MACSVHYDVRPIFAEPSDLQIALKEYRQRRNEQLSLCKEAQTRFDALTKNASMQAERTMVGSVLDATHEFLVNQLHSLMERINQLPDKEITAYTERCLALQTALEDGTAEYSSLFTAYTELASDVSRVHATTIDLAPSMKARALFHDETADLRKEIAASVLGNTENEQLRGELLSRLASLDALAEKQLTLASQSIQLFRQRLYREIRLILDRQEEQQERSAVLRQLLDEMLAQLGLIINQQALPTYIQHAKELVSSIETEINTSTPNLTQRLTVVSQQVMQFFGEYSEAIHRQERSEFLQRQLADAILSIGLTVEKTKTNDDIVPENIIARMNDDLGVEFHFETQGKIRAEMVAFSEGAASVLPDTIENGIALADRIVQSLSDRQCEVRERFRHLHKHPDGHRLRVVQVIANEEGSVGYSAIVMPKHMRANS